MKFASKTEGSRPTVGFIGLGAMGSGMASSLLRAGFDLVVCDLSGQRVAAMVALGARAAASAEEVAREASQVICMVETTAQAESVLFGPGGIVSGASAGHLVACMSTVDPQALPRWGAELARQGVALVEAPVSGGTEKAQSGELTVMVGGERRAFEAMEPVLKAMAANLFFVGAWGQATTLKAINNILVHVHTAALAEALTAGAKAGLDMQIMQDVIRACTGDSFVLRWRGPRMMRRDFTPGGTLEISLKDIGLMMALGERVGAPLPMAASAQKIFQTARDQGFARMDGSCLIEVYERLVGGPAEESGTRQP